MKNKNIVKVKGCVVVQRLACWTANHEVQGSNPGQDRNLYRDFSSNCAPSQLSYDEYNNRALSMRVRTGHLPSYAEAKKIKSLTLHTHGCPRAILRAALLFF